MQCAPLGSFVLGTGAADVVGVALGTFTLIGFGVGTAAALAVVSSGALGDATGATGAIEATGSAASATWESTGADADLTGAGGAGGERVSRNTLPPTMLTAKTAATRKRRRCAIVSEGRDVFDVEGETVASAWIAPPVATDRGSLANIRAVVPCRPSSPTPSGNASS